MLKHISTGYFFVYIALAISIAASRTAIADTIIRVDGEDGNTNAPSGTNPGTGGWGSLAYKTLQQGLLRAEVIHQTQPTENIFIHIRGKQPQPTTNPPVVGQIYRPDQSHNNISGSNDPAATFQLRRFTHVEGGYSGTQEG